MSFGLTKDTQLQVQVYLKCVYVLYSIYRYLNEVLPHHHMSFLHLKCWRLKWRSGHAAPLPGCKILWFSFNSQILQPHRIWNVLSSFLASYAFPICTNIIYTLVVSQTNNYFQGFVVVGGDGGGSGGEGGGSGPANCCTYFSVIMQQI